MAGSANFASPRSHNKYRSKLSGAHNQPLQEIQPPELSESKETLHEAQLDSFSARYVSGLIVAVPYLICQHTKIKYEKCLHL